MKIIIDLLYHGTKVDAHQRDVYQATASTKPVQIDIGMIVDQRVKDALARCVAKLKKKHNLDDLPRDPYDNRGPNAA